MWLWQQSGRNTRSKLQKAVIAASCGLHVIALAMIFVMYRGYYAQMHIDVARVSTHHDKPVLFMPLHKSSATIGMGKKTGSRGGTRTSKPGKKGRGKKGHGVSPAARKNSVVEPPVTQKIQTPQAPIAQKKPTTAVTSPQPTHKQEPVKTVAQKKEVATKNKRTVTAPQQEASQKKVPAEAKKTAATLSPPTGVENKVSQGLSKTAKKRAVKSSEKRAQVPEKIVPSTEEKLVEKEAQAQVVQETVVPEVLKDPVAVVPAPSPETQQEDASYSEGPLVIETGGDDSSDNVYVGQLEWDALEVQSEIKYEIERHWRPPAGLSPDLVCQIKIVVAWEGAVESLELQKRSGVLAYDVHARAAVAAMKFPKATWGKELIISFKQ